MKGKPGRGGEQVVGKEDGSHGEKLEKNFFAPQFPKTDGEKAS